jgi:inorganic phosphate transporter, PiT family
VRPLHALNSQMTSAVVILGASVLGAPVSTTHVVATSIMGIGYAERPKAVRWSKAGEIASTWAVTIPAGAMTAMLFFAVLQAASKAFGVVV